MKIANEAIYKMCAYLEHDQEGSPCMRCPRWEVNEQYGAYQRACYGLAEEAIEKALMAMDIEFTSRRGERLQK